MNANDIDLNDFNGPADGADQALTIPTLPEFPGFEVRGYVLKGYAADPTVGLAARADKVVFNAHKDDGVSFSLGGDLNETMRFILRNAQHDRAAQAAQSVLTYGLS